MVKLTVQLADNVKGHKKVLLINNKIYIN